MLDIRVSLSVMKISNYFGQSFQYRWYFSNLLLGCVKHEWDWCPLNLGTTESSVEIISLFHLGEETSQQTSSCPEGSDGRGQYQVCSGRT